MPTLTCTSGNVLPTLLAAFAELGPDARIAYGPDTYMGRNLRRLLGSLADELTDDEIRASLDARHDRASLRDAAERLDVFEQGHCAVHHHFGGGVARRVAEEYAARPEDTYVTAHLEVPGDMFELALRAKRDGRGAVGSTSDILNFIVAETRRRGRAGRARGAAPLRFILGTEAGMAAAVVRGVTAALAEPGLAAADAPAVEIVFPVADEAVAALGDADAPPGGHGELALVPGAHGGEGCSASGGCATCPFMKLNTLDALLEASERESARARAPLDARAREADPLGRPSPPLAGALPRAGVSRTG